MIQFIPRAGSSPLFGQLVLQDGRTVVQDEQGHLWPPCDVAMLVIDDLAQQETAKKSGYACHSPMSALLGPGTTSK